MPLLSGSVEQFNFTQLSNVECVQANTRQKQDRLKVNQWESKLKLVTESKTIPLVFNSKKERQVWLSEFSRAIHWADGVSPAKVLKGKKT